MWDILFHIFDQYYCVGWTDFVSTKDSISSEVTAKFGRVSSQIIFPLVISQSSQTNNFSHHQYTGWFLFLIYIYFVLMKLFQVDGKKKRKGSKVNKQLAYI